GVWFGRQREWPPEDGAPRTESDSSFGGSDVCLRQPSQQPPGTAGRADRCGNTIYQRGAEAVAAANIEPPEACSSAPSRSL
ncbi:hypothetical protein NDU88_007922, partial [Pleurodeles waltl]